jgi:hypothetical protein
MDDADSRPAPNPYVHDVTSKSINRLNGLGGKSRSGAGSGPGRPPARQMTGIAAFFAARACSSDFTFPSRASLSGTAAIQRLRAVPGGQMETNIMKNILRLTGLALALAAPFAGAADAAGPADSEAQDRAQIEAPLLVARADGSWTITRAIHPAPVSLAAITDGLVLLGGEELPPQLMDWEPDETREALRRAELEADERRAYEEAVDQARQAELTPQ